MTQPLSDKAYAWVRDTLGYWVVVPSDYELAYRATLVNAGHGDYAELHERIWQESAEARMKEGHHDDTPDR
jgi:hypothetical protein